MRVEELVGAMERASRYAGGAGIGLRAAICHMAGGIESKASGGDVMAMRAFSALASMAGCPEWVGDDGRPAVRVGLAQ